MRMILCVQCSAFMTGEMSLRALHDVPFSRIICCHRRAAPQKFCSEVETFIACKFVSTQDSHSLLLGTRREVFAVTWGGSRMIDDLMLADDRYFKNSTSTRLFAFKSTNCRGNELITLNVKWINLIFIIFDIAKTAISIDVNHMPFKRMIYEFYDVEHACGLFSMIAALGVWLLSELSSREWLRIVQIISFNNLRKVPLRRRLSVAFPHCKFIRHKTADRKIFKICLLLEGNNITLTIWA